LASVTCVIPSRDRAALLPRAIASVTAQEHPVEIVVVDDGSTDSTAELLARGYPGVKVLQTRGIGPAAARNLGVEAACGDVVMFLDSDDRWLPGHVERLLAAMEGCVAAYGVTRNVDQVSGGGFLVPEGGAGCAGDCLASLCRWCFIMTSAFAVRRDVFLSVRGFPEDIDGLGEDWGFFIRVASCGPFGFVSAPAVSERFLHPGSLCARTSREQLLDMYRKLLVIAAQTGKNERDTVTMRRAASWLSRIEENICLSVQQWYGRMRKAGIIPV